MMTRILSFLAVLVALARHGLFHEFKALPSGDPLPGWEPAFHEIEGRNGGLLSIPVLPGLWMPEGLKGRVRIHMRRRRRRP
jgi:hypothetical protein